MLLLDPILLAAYLLHPVHDLAVELFLNGDVRHGRCRRCPVPVLLAWREPDHIAGPDELDRSAFALSPATSCCDDESLSERMRVPRSPRARLECDARALNPCRIGRLKQGIDAHRAGEPV